MGVTDEHGPRRTCVCSQSRGREPPLTPRVQRTRRLRLAGGRTQASRAAEPAPGGARRALGAAARPNGPGGPQASTAPRTWTSASSCPTPARMAGPATTPTAATTACVSTAGRARTAARTSTTVPAPPASRVPPAMTAWPPSTASVPTAAQVRGRVLAPLNALGGGRGSAQAGPAGTRVLPASVGARAGPGVRDLAWTPGGLSGS